MNNPFDDKQLKDFTIADCESYLNQFPFGEHFIEVTKRLNSLKSGEIKSPEVNEGIKDTPESLHGEYQKKVIEGSGSDVDNKRLSAEPIDEKNEIPISQYSKPQNRNRKCKKTVYTNTQTSQTSSSGQQFAKNEEESGQRDIVYTILQVIGGIVGLLVVFFILDYVNTTYFHSLSDAQLGGLYTGVCVAFYWICKLIKKFL